LNQARVRGIAVASVLAFVTPLGSAPTFADDNLSVNLVALPPGKTVVIRFAATVHTPFPIGDALVSTQGTVAGTNFSPVPTDDPDAPGALDPTETPIDAAPDLVMTKSDGVTAVAPSSSTVYTLGVANVGDQAAAMVVVSETVPMDTTFNAGLSTPGWSCADGSPGGTPCTFTLGVVPVLPIPQMLSFAVTVVAAPAGTDIVNTASVGDDGANGPDRNPLDNSATDTNTLDGPEGDLTITKTNDRNEVVAGAMTTYTITVANDGPDDVVGARVTDTPPAALANVSWTCAPEAGASCTASGTGAIDDLADVPAGLSVVYTLTATVDASATGTVANTASVAVPLGTGDPDTGNNSATDTDTVVRRPATGDFNGDGRSDVVLFNATTGDVREWLMDGVNAPTEVLVGTQSHATARIVGTGDYDGNGQSDLLWQDTGTFDVGTWLNGSAGGPQLPPAPVPGPVVTTGDYDANGVSDILWLHLGTRQVVVWLMNNTATVAASQVVGTLGPNRSVRASADFNNDGRSDLFLMNVSTLATQIRFMDGVNPPVQEGTLTSGIPGWDVAGTGYFGPNAYADVLWHRTGVDRPELWTMNGATVESRVAPDHSFRGDAEVVGTGDYDGDGNADVLWLDPDTSGLRVWLLDGSNVVNVGRLGRLPDPASEWTVVRVR
jgi:uncharacterized repeat protein (TIGR01451 family)